MKKVWEEPKLVALVRSKPEERVLAFCKGEMLVGPGDGNCLAEEILRAVEYCKEFSTT